MKLTGLKLRIFRLARDLGVWRLYQWCSGVRHGGIAFHVPFYDPFDATHLLWALADRVEADDRTHIEFTQGEFASWLNEETRGTAGFSATDCLGTLVRELGREANRRTSFLAGIPGVHYFVRLGKQPRKVIIDVLWRRRASPKLTRGQHCRMNHLALSTDELNPDVIAAIWRDVLSRDWPHPLDVA